MAAGPLSRIPLAAASVADDLTYVALADISRLLHDQTTDYRIIGGLMVTALAARWDLGASLYREILDADLGVPPIAARDLDIAGRLKAAGYHQVAGDRFERPVSEVPAGISGGESPAYRAAIDVLVPAYTSRPRHNVRVGTQDARILGSVDPDDVKIVQVLSPRSTHRNRACKVTARSTARRPPDRLESLADAQVDKACTHYA